MGFSKFSRLMLVFLVILVLFVVVPLASAQDDAEPVVTAADGEVPVVVVDASEMLGVDLEVLVYVLLVALLIMAGIVALQGENLRRSIPPALLPILTAARDSAMSGVEQAVRATPSTKDDKLFDSIAPELGYTPRASVSTHEPEG